jgi:hypothetical protein
MRPRDGSGGVGRGAVRVLRAAPPRGRHGAGGRCVARGGSHARFGLVCLVRGVRAPPAALARRCGPRAARRCEPRGLDSLWMRRGVAHAVSGWCRRCGPRGCAGLAGSAVSGSARRRRAMRGARRECCAVWFGLCREYERLLPLVRDDAALGRPGVGSDGGFRVDGEWRCACGLGMVQAVWAAGLCGSCGRAASG